MKEYKLSDNVIESIILPILFLVNQRTKLIMINKLILNKKLKKHYKKYDLCKEFKQPNTNNYL